MTRLLIQAEKSRIKNLTYQQDTYFPISIYLYSLKFSLDNSNS